MPQESVLGLIIMFIEDSRSSAKLNKEILFRTMVEQKES